MNFRDIAWAGEETNKKTYFLMGAYSLEGKTTLKKDTNYCFNYNCDKCYK
jgi:hypothetical protein